VGDFAGKMEIANGFSELNPEISGGALKDN
jgi:hypothetical protein